MSEAIQSLISYVGKVTLEQLPAEWQKPVVDVVIATNKAVSFTVQVVLLFESALSK